MMRRALPLLLLLAAGPASAQRPRALTEGIAAYNQVEYASALAYLKEARRQARTREDRALAYYYLGSTYYALEQEERARQAFETLLAIEPGHAPNLQLTSPKIARFFAVVRQGYAVPAGPPSLTHQPPREAAGSLTPLVLAVHNLSPRLHPVVRYRSGSGSFTLRPDQRQGSRFSFAAPTPRGGHLVYDLALVDDDGVTVQQLGPFRVPVSGEDNTAGGAPWYRTWWFWTAVGAVAVGAGVGLGVGLSGGDDTGRAEVTILRTDASGAVVPIFQ